MTGRHASSVAHRNCHPGESRDPVAKKHFGDNPCAMPTVIAAEAGIHAWQNSERWPPAFAGTTRRKYVGNDGAESEPSAVLPSPEIALRF